MVYRSRRSSFFDREDFLNVSAKILHSGKNCKFLPRVDCEMIGESTRRGDSDVTIELKRKGQTIIFEKPPKIVGRMSVVGEKEGKGPVGGYFHKVIDDDKMHEKTFEKAEIDILTQAIKGVVSGSETRLADVDLFVAGDLLNQITSSSYVAREFGIPYLGVYSACSTMSESLGVAASLISAGYFDKIICATTSHFATAERQFRYPLEYGCQRPPYAQWTVTGAGATLLSSEGDGPKITAATFGKVIDFGTNDLNNMGAAMAPAAMNSMIAFFEDTGTLPEDYDLIITGDLGRLGSDILRDLMREKGYELGQNYIDCGCLIFDSTQKCYQGGSGCACSATVFNSFVLEQMEKGVYARVLYFATGALMSAQSCYQGETIPCISHGVLVER